MKNQRERERECLGWKEQLDPEAIESSGRQALRGGVVVAGVDDAVEIRDFILDGFDGAPQHSLSAATIIGVRMEEPHGSVSVPCTTYYAES